MSSYSRVQLEEWLGNIDVPEGAKVVDIGGSQKPITVGRVKTWKASEYKILDLPVPHEGVAPDIALDIQNYIEVESDLWNYNFDIAFCLEVTEYWWKPFDALRNINSLLKVGGILYISFHFIYPPHKPAGTDYLRYTNQGVMKLLKEAGFGNLEFTLRFAKNPELLMSFYACEGMKKLDTEMPDVVGYLIKCTKER